MDVKNSNDGYMEENAMKKKNSLRIGIILLVIAICFFGYVLNHPEASFPWSNKVTFVFYGCYIWLVFRFWVDGLFFRKNRNITAKANRIEAGIFFLVAILSLIMETMETDADIYTVLRGFCMLGGLDMGVEKIVMGAQKKDSTKR